MRLFCDQCGTELGSTTLRADSKFCSICGKSLSDFIKSQRGNFKTSPKGVTVEEKRKRGRPPGTFKRLRIQAAKPNGKRTRDEDEKDESESELEVKRPKSGRNSTPNINAEMDAFFNPGASVEENQDSEDAEVVNPVFALLIYRVLEKGNGFEKRFSDMERWLLMSNMNPHMKPHTLLALNQMEF